MKLFKIFILFISMFLTCSIYGQVETIDFRHKSLDKLLERIGGVESPILTPFIIPKQILGEELLLGKYFEVSDSSNLSKVRYVYTGRVNTCRAGVCFQPKTPEEEGVSEYFDYFIFFNNNSEVVHVKIFDYQATHGHEVTAKGWLKQFVGYQSEEKIEVDAISGATYSVEGIKKDVKFKTELLKKYLNLELASSN